jgi:hypothetical protein
MKSDEIVMIGGHYDSIDEAPYANLRARATGRTLRFVAFANEKPPYFQSESMGSFVYAKRCRARGEKIVAMISLESIGYFRDEEGSQQYPPGVGWLYPSRGNFVAFVSNLGSRSLVRRACAMFRGSATIASEGGALPATAGPISGHGAQSPHPPSAPSPPRCGGE